MKFIIKKSKDLMLIEVLKAKIHMAKVTMAELYYEGSLTVDKNLLNTAGILPYEKVQVVNFNNGARFETYTIEGEADSGTICLNGPAARLGTVGDEIIIISYAHLDEKEAKTHKPKIILVDNQNKVKQII